MQNMKEIYHWKDVNQKNLATEDKVAFVAATNIFFKTSLFYLCQLTHASSFD